MTDTGTDFNAIRISLASPEQVRAWSYGEVTKPETINYRTLRPEKDGLFCERIFGPTKDWECYCGKYKKIRYKGVVCDRCGVEIARAKVRRERMGHIKLAAPVAHIWFSKGTPSRLGLLLDLSPRNLERVLYFAQYIVISVDEEARKRAMESLDSYMEIELERLYGESLKEVEALKSGDIALEDVAPPEEDESEETKASEEDVPEAADGAEAEREEKAEPEDALTISIRSTEEKYENQKSELETDIQARIEELESIAVLDLLTEARYRELRDRYGEVFNAGMGAESILDVLKLRDLVADRRELQEEVRSTSGQRRKKAIKRLRVLESFVKSGNKPEWMVLTMLPVLPPELRPMVQLDGGRFATSDLNDLYRRVINRNNRLRRLLDLQAPEIIVRNEKRMLQEAVDALIDNGRRGRAISGSHNHKLKSLTDLLRGKQGRFRQNLLGKRVDYSGRSVIIVGPELRMHECGLPKKMALELFKPFVMNALVVKGFAHNIKSAKRMAERSRPEVWDILEEVIKNRPVLLNRAPTLHRLGIQAFQPVLVEGSAIRIHPLVCTAFNADFDGDQMAVHVPLSREAVLEAQRLMLSTLNMLSPASGDPIVSPTLDMVLGNFYLTTVQGESVEPVADPEPVTDESEIETEAEEEAPRKRYSSFDDARLAFDFGQIGMRVKVDVKDMERGGDWITTTVGRIIFNEAVPTEMGYINEIVDRDKVKELVSIAYETLGNERTADFLDALKGLGFRYATQSGITIAISDIIVPPEKESLLRKADNAIFKLEEQYFQGMITEDERYRAAVETWTKVNDEITEAVKNALPNYGGIYTMASSGAKGNIAQIKQMAGMRGLMSDPKGRIIDLPIRSSFREGLSVLEYFISTHGGRKGLADTALRTADSGYLTRRLADVAQDVIVLFEDCGTRNGIWVKEAIDTAIEASLQDRLIARYPAAPVIHPETGEILATEGDLLQAVSAKAIVDSGLTEVYVRSPLSCEASRGLCQMCYGASLATGEIAFLGEAAGIIAAQSIGEPGTQLTMRTFHTGGIAGLDITSGLPRVEELFEARNPRGVAMITEIDGQVEVVSTEEGREVKVSDVQQFREDYDVPSTHKPLAKTGDWIDVGSPILGKKKTRGAAKLDESALAIDDEILATAAGTVKVTKTGLSVKWDERDERVYKIPAASAITVATGETVAAGQALTAGPKGPQDILRIEGHESAQQYIISEVQAVYKSQGVPIHDKHIEVIIRQMLKKVRVDVPGDTDLLPGELIDRLEYERRNAQILSEGGEPATASPVLLGVTRASLNTDSFLAAASFQETARVLTEAAISGSVDHLLGLKENVIIGRLIPARMDRSEAGRAKLGLDQLGPRVSGTLSGTTDAPPTFEEALRAFGATEADFSGQGASGFGTLDRSVLTGDGASAGDDAAKAAQSFGTPAKKKGDSEEDQEAAAAADSLRASTSGDAATVLNDLGDDAGSEPEQREKTEVGPEPAGD